MLGSSLHAADREHAGGWQPTVLLQSGQHTCMNSDDARRTLAEGQGLRP